MSHPQSDDDDSCSDGAGAACAPSCCAAGATGVVATSGTAAVVGDKATGAVVAGDATLGTAVVGTTCGATVCVRTTKAALAVESSRRQSPDRLSAAPRYLSLSVGLPISPSAATVAEAFTARTRLAGRLASLLALLGAVLGGLSMSASLTISPSAAIVADARRDRTAGTPRTQALAAALRFAGRLASLLMLARVSLGDLVLAGEVLTSEDDGPALKRVTISTRGSAARPRCPSLREDDELSP